MLQKQDTLRSLSIIPIAKGKKYEILAMAPPVLKSDQVINLAEKQQYLTK